MAEAKTDNKRIAKNTLVLYARMLFTMLVGLFTSRVVLNTLGVTDYGIISVVGGVISLFTFLNGGMVSATQRYLNFELGSGNSERLRAVFSTAMQIHFLIAFGVILLGETIGLWFLMEKLVIPAERMSAAVWVYQFSVISCAVSIISVPYNAAIIAHERMSAFAYITILDVVLKLLIVYMLVLSPYDKLISYSFLGLLVQLLNRYIYTRYCHKHFSEAHFNLKVDRQLFKEMFSFAGWSFWGNLAAMLYSQGLNMMLNIFFGPVVNAARGIALQIQSAVQGFVGNFQMALNPQITKTFAAGDLDGMHSLMFRSARFSFLLLFIFALPIMLETDFILLVWLKIVPQDTAIFARLILCVALIYSIANPCVIANQATGKVKVYQMVVGGTLLLILPVSYIVLKCGAPAYSVFIVHFFIESLAQFFRMYMLRKLINLRLREYLTNIYIPLFSTVVVAIILPIFIHQILSIGWFRLFAVGIVSVISVACASLFIALTKSERMFILQKLHLVHSK